MDAGFGFTQLITILMTLSGFGVEPNTNAPTGAEVLRYAPADADYLAYVDFESFVPNNYQALTQLPSAPAIKSNPEAARTMAALIQQVDTARSFVKGATGMDLMTDLHSAAAWVTYPDAGDPKAVVAVRGTFPPDLITRLAHIANTPVTTVAGTAALVSASGDKMLGLTTDGTLLAGTTALVTARLAKSWKTPRADARTGAILDGKPFALIVSHPAKTALRRLAREVEKEPILTDLLGGHTYAALAFAHDGVSWTFTTRTRAGYDRAVLASEGAIELLRSGHLATRGLAGMILAVLGSYRGTSPEVDAILARKNDFLALAKRSSGDGNFKVKVDVVAAKNTITVKAWDNEFSDVVPLAGVLPAAGALFIVTPAIPLEKKPAKGGAPKPKSK